MAVGNPLFSDEPDTAADALEAAVNRFEDAWQRGERPDPDAFLSPELPRRDLLVELVHVDLEYRLKAGEAVRVEGYLQRYPELAADREAVLELMAAEYDLRRRGDDGMSPDEYARRFPQYAAELSGWVKTLPALLGPRTARLHQGNPNESETLQVEAVKPGAAPAGGLPAVPGYEILEVLGRGGMGVVYKARQVGLKRLVALKMLRDGVLAGPDQLARFRGEAEAIARLRHANIVQVHEVGEALGRPFCSLELVDGGSLADRLRGTPQPPRQAAALVETLARAVHAAHRQHVVHRDLKPANVLLTAEGEPKVTDFGLAKTLDGEKGQTQSGAILGTPSYMAPEQANSRNREVGPAADVWALGAILYECLTGRPPFKAETPLDTVLQVVSIDPVPPSRLQPKVPRDLETICLKCLEKAPARRYATAEALADDLRRFQAGEPIEARPAGVVERGVKWAKRRPAVATLLAVSALAAAGLLAVLLYFTGELRDERNRALAGKAEAEAQRHRAETGEADAKKNEEAANKSADDARKNEQAAKLSADYARRSAFVAQLLRVAAVCDRDPSLGLELLEHPRFCPPDLRDFTWGFYYRLCRRHRLTCAGHEHRVTAVTVTTDGKTLASASADGNVVLWDAATGQARAILRAHASFQAHAGYAWSVAFTPDGKTLATGGADGVVRLWDVATGKERAAFLGHADEVRAVALSRDGKTLAAAAGPARKPGEIKLWNLATEKEVATLRGHAGRVLALSFAADNQTLISGGEDKSVRFWDAEAGRESGPPLGHGGSVVALAVSADGRSLATASSDGLGRGEARVWDLADRRERFPPRRHSGPVQAVALAADGRWLASAGDDRTIKLWDGSNGVPWLTLQGHGDAVSALAFTRDGRGLVSGSLDRTVRLWDVAWEWERAVLRGHEGAVLAVALSPDGKLLASAGKDLTLRLWDVATGKPKGGPAPLPQAVYALAFSPDGKALALGAEFGPVVLWDHERMLERAILEGHSGKVFAVAFSPDGRTLASGSEDGTAMLWDVPSARQHGVKVHHADGQKLAVRAVAFTGDQTLVTGAGDGVVRLWQVNGEKESLGQERRAFKAHAAAVSCLALTADGKLLASGSKDGTVRLWDAATGKERGALQGQVHEVSSLAFSPDGKALATGGRQPNGLGAVRLWDIVTGQERAALPGHDGAVTCVRFTPDGRTLISGGDDQMIRLWEAAAPEARPRADAGRAE